MRYLNQLSINENAIGFVKHNSFIKCDFPGYAHDAILTRAYDVNRTLERGGKPDDGEPVTRNIFNFAFTGISGEVKL